MTSTINALQTYKTFIVNEILNIEIRVSNTSVREKSKTNIGVYKHFYSQARYNSTETS